MNVESAEPAYRRPMVALLVGAAVAATTALFVLIARPLGGLAPFQSWVDAVFTALLVPFALSMLGVLVVLHSAQDGRDGRLGIAGVWTAAVGLAGFVVCGVLTLITEDPHSGGALYPLSMIVSLVGMLLFAVGSDRARVLPRLLVPVLVVGWTFGGPVAESSGGPEGSPIGFPGASLILAAVYVLLAMTLARHTKAVPSVSPTAS